MSPLREQRLHPTIYVGTFIHTPSLGELEVLEKALVCVDSEGVIAQIHKDDGNVYSEISGTAARDDGFPNQYLERLTTDWGVPLEDVKWVLGRTDGSAWWTPGFVDTHIHASQYPNSGIFGKSTLLEWLKKYTFPLEFLLSDPEKARVVYNRCVARTLAHGTTTAAYYATIDPTSTNVLSDICLARGQRAFVGRCNMDSDIHPNYYRDESAESSVSATQATVQHINTIDPSHSLLTPIITPRFAPSCTSPLLSSLGSLAAEHDLPIQTHISENPSECSLVASRFPDSPHYAGVYDAHGLLTKRTVLAHAIHLSQQERQLIKERGSKISHCPVSNTYISSGMCPVRELLNEGIEVGLGTDVSGGWSPSVLVAAREAVGVSRNLAAITKVEEDGRTRYEGKERGEVARRDDNDDEEEGGRSKGVETKKKLASETIKLSPEEALYMATLGGARCLGLGTRVGSFEVGKVFDSQLITCHNMSWGGKGGDQGAGEGGGHVDQNHPVEFWGGESWAEKVAKWIYCGDDRNTKAVWVGGREVHRRR